MAATLDGVPRAMLSQFMARKVLTESDASDRVKALCDEGAAVPGAPRSVHPPALSRAVHRPGAEHHPRAPPLTAVRPQGWRR